MSNNKQLLKAIRELTIAVGAKPKQAQAPPKRKSRRRRRRAGNSAAKLGGPASFGGAGAGDVTITKTELTSTVKLAAGHASAFGSVEIRTGGDLPWLKVMAASFERARWTRLRIVYKPGCAMTQSGRFSMGFDWDWTNTATTRARISGYQPNAGCAVYQDCAMTIPVTKGPQRWFIDAADDYTLKGPGKAVWAVDATSTTAETVLGEIWIEYTVILSGPKA